MEFSSRLKDLVGKAVALRHRDVASGNIVEAKLLDIDSCGIWVSSEVSESPFLHHVISSGAPETFLPWNGVIAMSCGRQKQTA